MDQSNNHDARSAASEPTSPLDELCRTLSLAAALVLTFLVGALVTAGDVFPGPQIARALQGGKALYSQLSQYSDVYSGDIWYRERRPKRGVTAYVPGKAQEGLTLYTSGAAPAAYLIDMDGNLVHEWRRPFSTVWQAGSGGVAKPRPDPFVHFRNAHAFPNGDLVALYEGNGDTPYGYGVVKLDRNSEVIWNYAGQAHHQLSVAPDGKIYVLTHEIVDEQIEWLEHLARTRLEDFLVVLSPDGEELRKIRLLTTVAQSKYRQLLYTVSSFAIADPLHANAVDYIDRQAAANFAFGKEGQVLLSFRALNAIAVLDPETGEITWATVGPWIGQHDPDIQPNGNVLLFDNYANFDGREGISRVIEFDPRTMEIVWQYTGTAEHPLASRIRADQQRLANGNTLITEADGGRLVEVTPEGELAWEFMNPVRGGPDNKMIPIMAWAQRLDPASFDPEFLNSRTPVEQARTETSK